MKKKYTIGEIMATRKIGSLGKHSTAEDVVKLLGEPTKITLDYYKYSNYFMNYGNLGILISGVKKRILNILIDNKDATRKRFLKYGTNTVLKDWNKFVKLNSQGIQDYLLSYNIESKEIIIAEDISSYIVPKTKYNKFNYNHRHSIIYSLESNNFSRILIEYNYRVNDSDD
jgi:hypothetical protein